MAEKMASSPSPHTGDDGGVLVDGGQHLRLALISKTGHGKSSLGNLMIGRKVFGESRGFSSATDKCKAASGVVEGRRVTIVDSPGTMDTRDPKAALRELVNAIKFSPEGFHAFLIVVNAAVRYTKEEHKAIQALRQIFGDKLFEFSIAVFTHGDHFDNDEDQLKESLQQDRKGNAALNELLKWCNDRVALIENDSRLCDTQEQRRQIVSLLEKIEVLELRNNGLYTDRIFQVAQQEAEERRREEERRKKEKEEMEKRQQEKILRMQKQIEDLLRQNQEEERERKLDADKHAKQIEEMERQRKLDADKHARQIEEMERQRKLDAENFARQMQEMKERMAGEQEIQKLRHQNELRELQRQEAEKNIKFQQLLQQNEQEQKFQQLQQQSEEREKKYQQMLQQQEEQEQKFQQVLEQQEEEREFLEFQQEEERTKEDEKSFYQISTAVGSNIGERILGVPGRAVGTLVGAGVGAVGTIVKECTIQ